VAVPAVQAAHRVMVARVVARREAAAPVVRAAGVPAQAPGAVVPVVPVEDSINPDNAGIHDPVSCLGLCRHPSHPEPLDKIYNGKKDL